MDSRCTSFYYYFIQAKLFFGQTKPKVIENPKAKTDPVKSSIKSESTNSKQDSPTKSSDKENSGSADADSHRKR